MREKSKSDVFKGLAAGLIGGLVGTIVMTQFQSIVTQIGKAASDEKEKKT